MRASSYLRALGAGLILGGLSLTVAPAATAAPAGSFTLQCQTQQYPIFDWNVAVDAKAEVQGSSTMLTLRLSDLPGVAPVPMRDLGMTATLDVLVDGAPMTLTGQGMITFDANSPFAIPAASGIVPGHPSTLDVVIRGMAYNIPSFEMNTICPPNGATELRLAPVNVAGVPTPAPAPQATSAPAPSANESTAPRRNANAAGGTQAAGQNQATAPQPAASHEEATEESRLSLTDATARQSDDSGLGGALPLIGGSVLVFGVLGWFVFLRKPRDRSGSRRA